MVLSTLSTDHQKSPKDWSERLILRLSAHPHLLVVVVRNREVGWRSLLLMLREKFPSLRVLRRADDLLRLPENSLVMFLYQRDDAEGLNLHRSVILHQHLKIILWVREEDQVHLRLYAPDFFSWVSYLAEAPPSAPSFTVATLQALGRRSGCWKGTDLEGALEGKSIRVSARQGPERLLVEAEGVQWLIGEGVREEAEAEKLRAVAAQLEVSLILVGAAESFGAIPLTDNLLNWEESCQKLQDAGFPDPPTTLALLDLEEAALMLLLALRSFVPPDQLDALLLKPGDPGVALRAPTPIPLHPCWHRVFLGFAIT